MQEKLKLPFFFESCYYISSFCTTLNFAFTPQRADTIDAMEKKQFSEFDRMVYESMVETTLHAEKTPKEGNEGEEAQESSAQEKSCEQEKIDSVGKRTCNDPRNSAHKIATQWEAVADLVARDVSERAQPEEKTTEVKMYKTDAAEDAGGGASDKFPTMLMLTNDNASSNSIARKVLAGYIDDAAKVIEEAGAAASQGGQARSHLPANVNKGVCYRRRRRAKRPLKKDEPLPIGRFRFHAGVQAGNEDDMPLLTDSSDSDNGN